MNLGMIPLMRPPPAIIVSASFPIRPIAHLRTPLQFLSLQAPLQVALLRQNRFVNFHTRCTMNAYPHSLELV
jgi:hypothetical protein